MVVNKFFGRGSVVNSLKQLEQEAEAGTCSLYRFCLCVAELFKVRQHEVALLTLKHSMLQFEYPPELRKTGMIPLISSSQVSKTASSKRAEIFNNFISVRHSSVFETIKVGGDAMTIQKLMSVPVLTPQGDVFGVIQVSRKGMTPTDAGADFTHVDLKVLQDASKILGKHARKIQDRQWEIPQNSPAAV